ncbi:MAG: hypothetical protein QXU18_03940 [Thermoplasmatales archaeon]
MSKLNVIWVVILLVTPILSLWHLLFFPGFYSYSDQHFPISGFVQPINTVSLNPFSNLQFDRLFLAFPLYIIDSLTTNIQVAERLFLYYTFILYAFLCYVFSYLSTKLYSDKISQLSTSKRELAKFAIFILAYSNLSAMNLNADGGTWADGIILILLSISTILVLSDNEDVHHFYTIGALMLLSFLLDPDYAPIFIIVIFILALVTGLQNKNLLKSGLNFLLSLSVSLISIAYIYFQAIAISPMGTGGFDVIGYRPYTLGFVEFTSRNINPYNVLILFGHSWSTIAFSPPSIYAYGSNIYMLKALYNPPQVLLPPGPITILWLVSLITIPTISFLSLFFKSSRRYSIPLALAFLALYLVTEEGNLKLVYSLLNYATRVPILGNAIGTSLALPGHFMNGLAYLYLPLFSLGFLTLINFSDATLSRIKRKIPRFKRENATISTRLGTFKTRKNPSKRTVIVAIFVIFFLVLAGWQSFNGSFYPLRSYPSEYPIGNGVEDKGAYSPVQLSPSIIEAYNIVWADGGLNNNTLWIGGPSINDFFPMLPPLAVSLSSLPYLASNHLVGDIEPYLTSHSVRFVVISNDDIQLINGEESPDPFLQYGFTNYSDAISFFATGGLRVIFSSGGTTVFVDPHVESLIYDSNLLLNPAGMNQDSSTLYSVFKSIGYNVSLSSTGQSIGFNNNTTTIDIIPPNPLLLSPLMSVFPLNGSMSNTVLGILFHNSSTTVLKSKYYQNNSLGQYNVNDGNFTTTQWGGNSSYSFDNGSWSVASRRESTFSVDYNGALAGYPGGISISNTSRVAFSKIQFCFNASNDTSGNLSLLVLGTESNVNEATVYNSYNLSYSASERNVEFNTAFPRGTKYIDFRIQFTNFVGKFYLKYVNITYAESGVSSNEAPLGYYFELNHTALNLPDGYDSGYVLFSPVGSRTSSSIILNASLSRYTSVWLNDSKIFCVVLVRNGTLGEISKGYAVYNGQFINSYKIYSDKNLLKNYTVGLDGAYIFSNPVESKAYVETDTAILAEIAIFYSATVLVAFTLIALGIRRKSKRKYGK